MKETNVWLKPEELQHMLQGTLQWRDVTSRVSTSKTGIRKLGEISFEKQLASKQVIHPTDPRREKDEPSKRLEGQPVIWLLGSVGLLTLSSWFYYVIVAK